MASIAKVIELLADSEESWEDAARQAVERASETVSDIRNVYMKELQAVVEDGEITRYRANVKITFVVQEGLREG